VQDPFLQSLVQCAELIQQVRECVVQAQQSALSTGFEGNMMSFVFCMVKQCFLTCPLAR
jgi:hypothetical protein